MGLSDSAPQIHSEGNFIALSGALIIHHLSRIEEQVVRELKGRLGEIAADMSRLSALDTAGALMLEHLREDAEKRGLHLAYVNFRPEHESLYRLVAEADRTPPKPKPEPSAPVQLVLRLGQGTIQAWNSSMEIVEFFGQATLWFFKALRHPKHFRMASVARYIDETGIDAIPIISLIAFLIAVVLAYQGSAQLKPLGADQYTVNLVGVSVLREMGVLLTAIMVAGRSGSAFAAEIGVMKLREEVDALQMIGIDPFEMLVMPRLIALIIVMPLLTFIANIMGLFGGGVICSLLLDMPPHQYIERLHLSLTGKHFFVGMIKAPVFAFLIALVGCMHGMKVTGSAESVGQHTTASVVHSIFLVLVMDALFSVFFAEMKI